MQITVHYCDFSTQVPNHLAHFSLSLKGVDGERVLGKDRIDACTDHLDQMLRVIFKEGAKHAMVSALGDPTEIPLLDVVTTNPRALVRYCDECRKAFGDRSSLISHCKNVGHTFPADYKPRPRRAVA